MYRTDLDSRHKSGALAAVIAVHVGLAFALLHLSGTVDLPLPQDALEVFDLDDVEPVPPPPPPPPPPKQEARPKPKEEEGGSQPKNIRSEPTPVVAPEPKIELPSPPAVSTETPAQGTAPSRGASDVRGPGTGAGGTGTGTGSGSGAGSGSGGGGGGGAVVRTQMVTGPLRGRDFPRALLNSWPRGAWAFMRFRVDADGNIMQCIMDRGTGNPAMDSQICAIAQRRLRFRPALDANGRRVADWAGYRQEPPR